MSSLVKSAIIRAVRTFVAAFLGVYGLPQLFDWVAGRTILDTSALRAAAAAGISAVIAYLWRAFLDPSGVPSLVDNHPPATIDHAKRR